MAEEIVTEKKCVRCNEVKPLDKFAKRAKARDGRRPVCRACLNAAYAYLTDTEYNRRQGLWRKYGLTPEDYAAMVEKQNGRCAVCHGTSKTRLHVDHCHTTGRVRGLLCAGCNKGIGSFRDRPDVLRAAAEYLENVEGECRPVHGRFGFIKPPHNRHIKGDDHPYRNGKQLIGEKHGMAIFTEEQIREFRRRYDSGEITSTALAKEQGVPKTTMQAITSRRNWKHVE